MPNDAPLGQRFSHVYIKRGEPVADSPRMRLRLSEYCPVLYGVHEYLTRELGVPVEFKLIGRNGAAGVKDKFFKTAELWDVLDAVTLVFRLAVQRGSLDTGKDWLSNAGRVFREENVGYRVDDQGGVHFFLDQAFDFHRAAAIASLSDARYANALSEFDRAHQALDQIPADYKSAIRSIFTTAEGLFRLMFPDAPRLGAKEIGDKMPQLLDRLYAQDQTAKLVAAKLVSSFKEWVNAAHFYRHEQGQQEPVQPPHTIAVLLIDQGATIIRWLAEVETLKQLKEVAKVGP